MPPESPETESASSWLRRARSNLARARAGRVHQDILFADCCFDAQQAAEKAIKAVLVHRRIMFPKTHAIERLLRLVEQSGLDVPASISEADLLTVYATDTRYPGASEEVDAAEYQRALEVAVRVVEWATESCVSRTP